LNTYINRFMEIQKCLIMIDGKTKMKQKDRKEDNGEKQANTEDISIAAPPEEWREVERLITSYRKQCRTLRNFSARLEKLDSFQRRLTQTTGWKSPDDYFI
jgi:hypothetical protein